MSEMVRLGDVCEVITKGTTPTTLGYDFMEHGINFVKVESIDDNGNFIPNKFAHISKECHKKLSRSILKENDILFSIAGAIGKTAIVKSDILPANTNQALSIIRLSKSNILHRYVEIALNSNCIYNQFEKQKQGVAQLNLSLKNISDLVIPLPPLNEQKHIVDVLDKVTDLIAQSKRQLELLDELVKARFMEMFGDMITNPNKWDKVSLGMACDVRDGTHDSPKYYNEGYPLVTSKNVTSGKIDFKDCNLICKEDYQKINERSKVDLGDILMPMIGTVGKPVIVDIEAQFAIKNVALIKFNKSSKVINIFVKSLLQSDYFDNAVISKIRGGTQKFIALGDIRKLEIFLPPKDRQEQFATFVKQTDKSKLAVKQVLEKAETLKKALMQKYFG